MAITATTLASAVALTDTVINVASATGITAPNFTSGAGITWLLVDQEFMLVQGVTGTFVSVSRGQNGSAQAAHVINGQVQIGLPGDFAALSGIAQRTIDVVDVIGGMNLPAVFLSGSTDVIPAGVPGNYVVKTAGVNAMTLAAPPAAAEGNVITVFSDTTNAHTITATTLFANGTALKTTATFPAFRGAGVTLKAVNGVWHVMANASAGQVVFS